MNPVNPLRLRRSQATQRRPSARRQAPRLGQPPSLLLHLLRLGWRRLFTPSIAGGEDADGRNVGRHGAEKGTMETGTRSRNVSSQMSLEEQLKPGESLYEIVFSGGAVLRSQAEINSSKIADLRRGELLVGLEERGRRVYVRTADGLLGWTSLHTSEDSPILRLLARRQTVGPLNVVFPQDAASTPRSSRLHRSDAAREDKWHQIHGTVENREAVPLIVRRSGPGLPLRRWRPQFSQSELPSHVDQRPEPVPRLSAPAPPSNAVQSSLGTKKTEFAKSIDLIFFDQIPGPTQHAVVQGEDLLDLEEQPPMSDRSRVPSLAEILRQVPETSDSLVNSQGSIDNVTRSETIADMLPGASIEGSSMVSALMPTTRSKRSDSLDEAPRRRTNVVDSVREPMAEPNTEGLEISQDAFEFLGMLDFDRVELDPEATGEHDELEHVSGAGSKLDKHAGLVGDHIHKEEEEPFSQAMQNFYQAEVGLLSSGSAEMHAEAEQYTHSDRLDKQLEEEEKFIDWESLTEAQRWNTLAEDANTLGASASNFSPQDLDESTLQAHERNLASEARYGDLTESPPHAQETHAAPEANDTTELELDDTSLDRDSMEIQAVEMQKWDLDEDGGALIFDRSEDRGRQTRGIARDRLMPRNLR